MKVPAKLQSLKLERALLLDAISEALPIVCPEDALILGALDIQIMVLEKFLLKQNKDIFDEN